MSAMRFTIRRARAVIAVRRDQRRFAAAFGNVTAGALAAHDLATGNPRCRDPRCTGLRGDGMCPFGYAASCESTDIGIAS